MIISMITLGNFIIDVALAYPIDEEASGYTYLLPEYVHLALEGGTETTVASLP